MPKLGLGWTAMSTLFAFRLELVNPLFDLL